MGKNLGDRARSGQRPPSALCMSLLHHTTVGIAKSVDFCSQRLPNGHFFTTHVENQTVPLILLFFWETFKYYSLWMYSTRVAFVRSNLANL